MMHAPERRRRPRGRFHTLADALYGTLRFIGRHVQGFFGALAAFLTVGMAVGIFVAFVFAAIGHLVMQGITQAFDEAVLRWIAGWRTPLLDQVALEVTSLGNTMVVVVMLAVASVFLWLTHHHYSVYLLVLAIGGGALLNGLLKDFYERPRPDVIPWITETSSPSFPSGHAMTAVIAYGAVAYLVARLEPDPALRRATWICAIVLILAIGTSRMYLGVHYPSDIVAGFVAGAAWLVLVGSTLAAIRFFAGRRPEVEEAEQDLHAEEERRAGLRP